MGVVKLEYDNF